MTLNGLDGDAYFIDLKDALTRDVGMNVPLAGSLHTSDRYGADALDALRTRLFPLATILTPNVPKADFALASRKA